MTNTTFGTGQNTKPGQSFGHRLLREPLLHFLLLAAGLFGLQALFAGEERELILVDAQAQQYLFQQEQDLRLRPLTEAEKQAIIDNYIEEEILVREATARGFADSSRVRALLVQNMRFFIGSDIPEPDETVLLTHFQANADDFTSPPSIDLNHVLFSDPAAVPNDVLTRLNNAEKPAGLGDPDTRLGYTLRYLDQRRLVRLFGAGPARELLDIDPGDANWRGPYERSDGSLYFLRVVRHNAPRTPDFETARNWIRTHWLSAKTRELLDETLASMKQNYVIEVQPLEGQVND